MAINDITLHWFLSTTGDSRGIMSGGHGSGVATQDRVIDLRYLKQLALAAETNGFESMLTPTGLWCDDAWLATASLLDATETLKFLVAIRPGLVSPTLIAQQAATYQKLSNNRLLLNVVVGGEDREQAAYGDHSTKKQRYWRADEALQIARALWTTDGPVDFHGEYYDIEAAQLKDRPEVLPKIFLGGSSDDGVEVAARQVDTYITWGEPVDPARAKIDRVRDAARRHDRELDYAIRLHVIARDTSEEAWGVAQKLLDAIDSAEVAKIQEGLARSQSEGQRRMSELHGRGEAFTDGADAHSLEIAPNLWAGVGLLRGGAGTALVGSYDEVAERIQDYYIAGFTHFVLSGYPQLEESFHVGEGVVPALKRRGVSVTNH
ncbi:LLM class flavin-dependent oxidoreductase [Corynebacterium senegalense]|uniref:LLM class flavin-dependent oxidoreductase n=1 Tax=Corynebacterium senegalense TaxID=2080750 RepID=UPI000E2054F5|nr:LLM class flavin-dependent oxidoreductase [Corynebacterium senegalense]